MISSDVVDTTLGACLLRAAERADGSPALVARGAADTALQRWSFGQLLAESERAARALLGRFEPGEHVAIWAPNVAETYLTQLACALAGIVAVPVPTGVTASELRATLAHSGATGLVLMPEYRGVDMTSTAIEARQGLTHLREILDLTKWADLLASAGVASLPAVEPRHPVQVQYSSGTTGAPKGIVLHHRGVANAARFLAERACVTPEDRWLNFMSLSYVAGSAIAAPAALQAGCLQVLCDFEPGAVVELSAFERPTVTVCGPTMMRMLLDHPASSTGVRSLRAVWFGGAAAPLDLSRRTESETGGRVGVIYGMTELCGGATQTDLQDPDEIRLATAGTPLPGAEVGIFDPASGSMLPPGAQGEVRVRGYQVMTGYLNDPTATAAAIDGQGWLHTGDLGSLGTRGELRIVGRLKDIINRGGRKLIPAEVESVLARHAGVLQIAVAALPDEHWGEIAAAFVVPSEAARPSEQELIRWCRASLAPYKTPERWFFVGELPFNRAGKVQKWKLVEQVRETVS